MPEEVVAEGISQGEPKRQSHPLVYRPRIPLPSSNPVSSYDPGANFSNAKGTDYRYHTAFALSVAFIIVFATQMYKKTGAGATTSEKTGNSIKDSLNGASGAASLKAWAFIAFVLFSMASFKSTQSLAAAFSWLILISVVLINGQQLLTMVGAQTTPKAPATTTKIQSGKYTGKQVPL